MAKTKSQQEGMLTAEPAQRAAYPPSMHGAPLVARQRLSLEGSSQTGSLFAGEVTESRVPAWQCHARG